MSLETDVMRSFNLCCNAIKDKVMADLVAAVGSKKLTLTRDQLSVIDKIVRNSVDYTSMNSSKEMQHAINKHTK